MNILNIFKFISRVALPKTVVVGVDIQEKHVALVASTRRGGKGGEYVSGVEALPEGTIIDGELKNPHMLHNALQKLIGRIPIAKMSEEPVMVLSLPPAHMYSEMVIFPRMRREELEEAVRLKMETSLPWPPDETYADWKLRNMDDAKRVGVFIAAIHKPLLDAYMRVFLNGGWRVAACEFHLLSLAQSGKMREQKEPYIFVLIDEDGIEFAVFRDGEIMVHFAKSIKVAPGVSPEERENIKTKIVFEIKRLVAYAETELGIRIANVIVFNKADIQAEMEQLQKEIDLPVHAFAPSEDPALHIALGASAREFDIPEKTVNFLPHGSGGRYNEHLMLRTLGLWTRMVGVFSLVMIMVFFGFFVFLKSQSTTLREEAGGLKDALNAQTAQATQILEFSREFNRLADLADRAARNRTDLGVRSRFVFSEAEKENVEVRRIEKTTEGNSMKVRIFAPTREALLEFRDRIEAGISLSGEEAERLFTEVRIPVLQLTEEVNLTVDVELIWE